MPLLLLSLLLLLLFLKGEGGLGEWVFSTYLTLRAALNLL